ncbi:YicC/YloC family endoribonuclease [Mesobacillus harenae]|uniref:YicC/YloC family endoribonuclease n=1 Tax=Mesobacillus harenae TaxID=2213203 RepID=UPI001580575A|nr:YicC/YloC family endoribonuclease [Mesobacillus harenae]
MIVSMTGFGRSKAESERFSVTVEVKTVNHRFCEYHIRMPRQLLKMEDKVKKKLGEFINRGRAEVFVTLEGEGIVNRSVNIDWSLLDEYYQYIAKIKEKYDLSGEVSIRELISGEGIITIEENEAGNEELSILLLSAVEDAASQLQQMRVIEGEALEKDVSGQINLLSNHIDKLKDLAPLVIEQYQTRLEKRMSEFLNGHLDEARILAEVAIFAEKADINEELIRLSSHIGQFLKTLQKEEPVGRKLDFLLQEMNREVNTIGSKANDSAIASGVVEMKSTIEKVKEQVQNIE